MTLYFSKTRAGSFRIRTFKNGAWQHVGFCRAHHRRMVEAGDFLKVYGSAFPPSKDEGGEVKARWCEWCGEPILDKGPNRYCGDACKRAQCNDRQREQRKAKKAKLTGGPPPVS